MDACRSRVADSRPSGGRPGSVTLEITTLNKTDFCLNNLRILRTAPRGAGARQGSPRSLTRAPKRWPKPRASPRSRAALGGKLRIIDQDNLGGSGGFARGMYEAVENGSDYVLLLDDDVVIEPESIIRLVHLRGPLQEAHHRRRAHVRPLRPDRPAHLWRDGQPVPLRAGAAPPGPGAAATTSRSANLRQTAVDAPACRRRLQRLVDVPDPHRRSSARSACPCPSSSSGTTPSTGCARRPRVTTPFRCRVRQSGMCPGSTRTTWSAGRPTSTPGTGSSRPAAQPL